MGLGAGQSAHELRTCNTLPGTVSLVVDTNLFHECRSLDAPDFPWGDLGDFYEIELIVSAPVNSELDRHKKDTRPRVKKRAVAAVSWFREMLQSDTDEHVFRERNPHVVMRLSAQTASQEYPEFLDMAVDDDRIVGVAAALVKANPAADIRVLSDDTRPILKAKAIGLKFEFIPPSWLRPPEADEQEKEIARLNGEIAELQKDFPLLVIEAADTVNNRLALNRVALASLTPDESAQVRAKLLERFSHDIIEDAIGSAATKRQIGSTHLKHGLVYVGPKDDSRELYQTIMYPEWIEGCLEHIGDLPYSMNNWIATMVVEVTLENTGYRPAEDVRIRFAARGNFLILPTDSGKPTGKLRSLPEAPQPPTGKWLRNGEPIAFNNGTRWTHAAFTAVPPPPPRLAPLPREDERWYPDPAPPEEPVATYGLVCRRFRHEGSRHPFRMRIFPQSDQVDFRGALRVEVSASNIGRAQNKEFPLRVTSTFRSPMPEIERFLAQQNPIGSLR